MTLGRCPLSIFCSLGTPPTVYYTCLLHVFLCTTRVHYTLSRDLEEVGVLLDAEGVEGVVLHALPVNICSVRWTNCIVNMDVYYTS